jgi:hypothetical protein
VAERERKKEREKTRDFATVASEERVGQISNAYLHYPAAHGMIFFFFFVPTLQATSIRDIPQAQHNIKKK